MNSSFQDKEYWESYYNTLLEKNGNTKPSPFAQYLVDNDFIHKSTMIELGCGNGRDSLFFSQNDSMVTAIDQCANTTKLLDEHDKINSYAADFTNLPINKRMQFDIVYSRFTIHSIDEEGENRTLKWAYASLKEGGCFCIEARTTKDPLCGKGIDKGDNIWFYNDHHRRFINAKTFKNKFEKIGFKVILFIEDKGLAKYKTEDPIVLRLIAQKVNH